MKRTAITVTLLILLSLSGHWFPMQVSGLSEEVVEYNILVIPVYSDETMPDTSVGTLMDLMAAVGEYFYESSYGRVEMASDVLGWLPLPNAMETYRAETTYPNGATRVTANRNIVTDAISSATGIANFEDYDGLVLVHAGVSDQQSYGDNSSVGSCFIPSTFFAPGVTFEGATVVSESDPYTIVAHELTHWLGASDLYDYTKKDPSISVWCLMGNGRYGMTSYTKISLGFLSENEVYDYLIGSIRLTLSPLSSGHKEYRALRINLLDGRYYLIEAREQIGLDEGLPSSGVLVGIVNQSAIDWRVGGVTLQLPEGSESRDNATFRVGEIYSSESDGIVLRVVDYTEDGFVVEISDTSVNKWIVTERLLLPEGATIREVDITQANHSGDHTYFMSIVVDQDNYRSVRLYGSHDEGRSWRLYLDSSGWFNVSINARALCYYDNTLMFISNIEIDNDWFVGLVSFDLLSERTHMRNLSSDVNERLMPWLDASSDGSHLYISVLSRNSSTPGVTELLLHNYTWTRTWRPLKTWGDIRMSNRAEDKAPVSIFRNETGLYVYRFNSNEIVQVTSSGTWYADIAQGSQLSLAFNHMIGNDTRFRIMQGSLDAGFQEVFSKNVTSPGRSRISIADDIVDVIEMDMGVMTLHRVEGTDVSSITGFDYQGYLVMPDLDSPERVKPLVMQGYDNVVVAVYWGVSTPDDVNLVIWFFEVTDGSVPIDYGPLIAAGISVSVILIVLVIYVSRPKDGSSKITTS